MTRRSLPSSHFGQCFIVEDDELHLAASRISSLDLELSGRQRAVITGAIRHTLATAPLYIPEHEQKENDMGDESQNGLELNRGVGRIMDDPEPEKTYTLKGVHRVNGHNAQLAWGLSEAQAKGFIRDIGFFDDLTTVGNAAVRIEDWSLIWYEESA